MLEQYHKMCKNNATIALHLDCLDLQWWFLCLTRCLGGAFSGDCFLQVSLFCNCHFGFSNVWEVNRCFFSPIRHLWQNVSVFKKKDSCHFNANIRHKLDLDVKAFFLCIVLAHWVLQAMLA
jgi:hypothetical protein